MIKKWSHKALLLPHSISLLLFIAISFPALAEEHADMLDNYRLEYTAKVKGFNLVTERSLKNTNGMFELTQTTKTTILEGIETSQFNIINQQFVSLGNSYSRKVFGKKLNRKTQFSPNTQQAIFSENDKALPAISVPKVVFDSLTYQERIRFDLIHSQGKSIGGLYPVLEKERIRDYEFEMKGSEIIDSPLGKIDCLKIVRVRKNSDKETTVWLAKQWQYIIVKIEHREKDKASYELNIKNGSINGKEIAANTPINSQSH